MQQESISLFQKKGTTDKEYRCHLEQSGDGWLVYGRNGRRGGNLTHQAKHEGLLPYAEAKAIYDKLVRTKMKDGYTPNESGVPFQGTQLDETFTGVIPQLLNPISEERAQELLQDDDWVLQEKDDGHRRMISIKADKSILGIRRTGFPAPLPLAVVEDLSVLPVATVLDGEAMGAKVSLFDMLELEGRNLHIVGFLERHKLLQGAFKGTANVRVSPVYEGTEAKTAAFHRIQADRGEGVVFRHKNAPYSVGRPSSGGDVLKYVFYATSTFVVDKVAKGKRSVHVVVFDEAGNKVDMGKVTIPANFDIPPVGALVDVRYLYAYRDGKLHISTYRGIRDDLDISACTTAQLKYKADGVDSSEDDEVVLEQAA